MRKLWIILLLIPALVFGQEFAKVGTVGTKFLNIGIGARGAGMGGAFEAVSNDVTSIFHNPAGITNVENYSVFLSHIDWVADSGYDAVAVVKKYPRIGAFGFSLAYMNSGDIERTTVENPDGGIGYFSTDHMFAGLTYARDLSDKFAFGANIKYIHERLDDQASNAWATDFGVRYLTGFHTIRMAMSIRNFGPEIRFPGTYVDLNNGEPSDIREYLPYHFPMTFKLGLAMELLQDKESRVTLAGDIEHPNDNLERVNMGVEAVYKKMLALRSGYTFKHDTAGLAFGAGFIWQKMSIDYSYTDYGLLDWVHRFDFIFNI
jgi:hypothetical protein